jgi:hypothetical protein
MYEWVEGRHMRTRRGRETGRDEGNRLVEPMERITMRSRMTTSIGPERGTVTCTPNIDSGPRYAGNWFECTGRAGPARRRGRPCVA